MWYNNLPDENINTGMWSDAFMGAGTTNINETIAKMSIMEGYALMLLQAERADNLSAPRIEARAIQIYNTELAIANPTQRPVGDFLNTLLTQANNFVAIQRQRDTRFAIDGLALVQNLFNFITLSNVDVPSQMNALGATELFRELLDTVNAYTTSLEMELPQFVTAELARLNNEHVAVAAATVALNEEEEYIRPPIQQVRMRLFDDIDGEDIRYQQGNENEEEQMAEVIRLSRQTSERKQRSNNDVDEATIAAIMAAEAADKFEQEEVVHGNFSATAQFEEEEEELMPPPRAAVSVSATRNNQRNRAGRIDLIRERFAPLITQQPDYIQENLRDALNIFYAEYEATGANEDLVDTFISDLARLKEDFNRGVVTANDVVAITKGMLKHYLREFIAVDNEGLVELLTGYEQQTTSLLASASRDQRVDSDVDEATLALIRELEQQTTSLLASASREQRVDSDVDEATLALIRKLEQQEANAQGYNNFEEEFDLAELEEAANAMNLGLAQISTQHQTPTARSLIETIINAEAPPINQTAQTALDSIFRPAPPVVVQRQAPAVENNGIDLESLLANPEATIDAAKANPAAAAAAIRRGIRQMQQPPITGTQQIGMVEALAFVANVTANPSNAAALLQDLIRPIQQAQPGVRANDLNLSALAILVPQLEALATKLEAKAARSASATTNNLDVDASSSSNNLLGAASTEQQQQNGNAMLGQLALDRARRKAEREEQERKRKLEEEESASKATHGNGSRPNPKSNGS